MTQAKRILIVEDEPGIAELLRYNFEKAGYAVETAVDGREGLAMAQSNPPSLLVLDWMLPHVSGPEICRALRASPATAELPVILLTARSEEADKIAGLQTGADDYVTKPFSPAELIARVAAVLRRSGSRPTMSSRLKTGKLEIDTVRHRVFLDGIEVKLGPTEFRLLHLFMKQPGEVFSRERLLELVWEKGVFVEARTVDVHIRRLRKALGDGEGESGFIRTVRSAGYALEPEGYSSPSNKAVDR